MNLSRSKERNVRKLATAFALSALAFSVSVGAEEQEKRYTMTAIVDAGFGHQVTAGDYEKAIQRITSPGYNLQDSFEAQTNLCVAYTKSGAIGEAIASCDAAISRLERSKFRDGRSRTDMALALSNRGVLHAVQGEMDLARQTFVAAADLKSGLAAPATNLARLDGGYMAEAN